MQPIPRSSSPHPLSQGVSKWISANDEYFLETKDQYGVDVRPRTAWEMTREFANSACAPFLKRPIKKLLCANRGEIAIRVFRAAHEIGIKTVSIYSFEDRLSLHRYASDESYLVGEGKSPVAAYLDIDGIIDIALDCGVDAIHPGYGFLSENAEFAAKVTEAGIIFIGPSAEVIRLLGDKTSARDAAVKCNVPVIPGTDGPCRSLDQAKAFVRQHGLPVLIKAAFGGGGRGMRVVSEEAELEQALERAMSEALSNFGDGTVFIEKFLSKPRHIEVQILGDLHGNIVHLFERDCSVQRRHQKVVEIGPAQNLDDSIRQKILNDAVRLTKSVGYSCAGTVEFLVEGSKHYFIEVNPRIQVEHTVTEQITGVDLVRSQIYTAAGSSLESLELLQKDITCTGCAIQLRITTEDPQKGFQPDTGRLEVYRSSGGPGIRLDSSTTAGRIISAHYDSLLVKVTGIDRNFHATVIRVLRAITEFRIRGLKTNIPFLQRLLVHSEFLKNRGTHTKFIDQTPELFDFHIGQNRAGKLLAYLSDVIVNGVDLPNQVPVPEINPVPPLASSMPNYSEGVPSGWRDILVSEGPKAFAQAVRRHKGLLIMDTTWRDAHQSLLATRVRTVDLKRVAEATSHAMKNAFSIEMWGGATFDVCLRFLKECPWDRLKALRELVPNVPFQMLLRGANAVGYTSYPDNVVFEFVRQAKLNGIDIFRIFDSLNYIENLKLGIEAVHAAGGVVEASICYSGDVSDPLKTKYDLQYYLDLVDELVQLDIHILSIKDMAGLLKPRAATMLVSAIREKYPDLPIHVHTHDTAGTGVASMLSCANAGADIIDCAIDSLSGLTSQPSMGAIVGSLQRTDLDTGIDPLAIRLLNDYWEQCRKLYAAFESDSLRSGNADVYIHEMPGGQYTNLQFQAFKLGLGTKWPAIKTAYAEANLLLGDLIKVTPSSKVVGDLAQFMVQNDLDMNSFTQNAKTLSLPSSVVQFLQGYLGIPYKGFPEQLRRDVLKDLPFIDARPGSHLPPLDLSQLKEELTKKHGPGIRDVDVISAALYPKVFDEYAEFHTKFSNVTVIPSRYFFFPAEIGTEFTVSIERGKLLYIRLLAVGSIGPSGKREVFWELNGNSRRIEVQDKSAGVSKETRAKADADIPGSIGAPMGGVVVEVRVKKGSEVKAGDPLVVLSAMKMETVVSATVSGRIDSFLVKVGDSLDAQDLIATITL